MKKIIIILGIALLLVNVSFATDIQLIVDGENITASSNPVIENSRLLVPIKFVSDEIGADVVWDGTARTVVITKGGTDIKLWIDSPIFMLNGDYKMSDVSPKIINDRTYVPVKLISNVFNIDVKWIESSREVVIDSTINADYEDVFEIDITSLNNNAVVSGETLIALSGTEKYSGSDHTMKLLLLDPNDMRGYILASSSNINAIRYLPKVEDSGSKLLVAAVYDGDRNYIAGDVVSITQDINPKVSIAGVSNEIYKSSVVIGQQVNFLAQYVSYTVTEVASGEITTVSKRDPVGTYSFKPTYENNGDYKIQVTAYDGNDQPFYSDTKTVTFAVDKYLNMGGVSNGKIISDTVSLIASRNFDVNETIFYIRDRVTGVTEEIATIPWGSYQWTPTEAYTGEKEFYVSVIDTKGVKFTSAPVAVTIDTTPRLYLKGVGPNQILTGDATLSASSNVDISDISYWLSNGTKIGTSSTSVNYSPSQSGDITVHATAMYNGKELKSDSVSLSVYLGSLYSSKPIVEKSSFKEFISDYAINTYQETGMTASLQVAQAILETGWGQYIPVDKYSGKFSNNLFGVKGSATNGSVTSNTWEVYNGVSFRTDADFRAYNKVEESWDDHSKLLLEKSRYQPYRDVMYDSTLGAYAIRRCGYATDPNYPMKLIDIIDMYDLEILDRVGVNLK